MRERRLIAEAITDNIGLELESHMREFICDAIFNSLRLTEERCKMFFQEQLEKKRSLNEIKRHHAHMEDYLHQSFRQRNIQLCSELSEFDANTTEPHVKAIRRNATMLKDNLNLEGTLLLDTLMENDVLSEAGRKSILSRKTPVAKNCAFLDHVTKTFNANSFKTVFLPALQKEHEYLSNKLEKDLDLPNASFPAVRRCHSCEVKSKIKIRKFANHLHQSGIIDEALCSDLVVSDRPQDERWNLFVKKLKKSDRAVMWGLRMVNEQFYELLKTTNSSLFVCTCDELETLKSDVTVTEDSRSGEPDAARMSDFSEVDSISSPTLNTDRRHQNFSYITNAPPQFISSDQDTPSPSLSPALNNKDNWRDENVPYVDETRDGWQTLGLIHDSRDIRHLRRKRKRYHSFSSPSLTKVARFKFESNQHKHEQDTKEAPFPSTSSISQMLSASRRRRFIPEFEVEGHQPQAVPDTMKALLTSTRSISQMLSASVRRRFIPEFEDD